MLNSKFEPEKLTCFQVYSYYPNGNFDFMVDKIWIEGNRVFFRVLEEIPPEHCNFIKEHEQNVYSIRQNHVFSIRCRLYF